ncbi:MAG TPA: HAMP domain-containing sensor histidine kinase [Bacteroidales bacterium]|nr:HAMP domain-containing sensor histidine kinase [Bacteroidales bacterium]
MNKKAIYLIIILMTITVIALFSIQFYWIQNAIALREANFSRSVKDAMSNVIYKLEKMEVADKIRSKMYKNKQGEKILHTIDSINNIYAREIDAGKSDTGRSDSGAVSKNIFNVTSEKINVAVLQEHTGEIIKTYDTTIVTIQKRINSTNPDASVLSDIPALSFGIDSVLANDLENVKSNINNYLDKTALVNDVFNDLFKFKHYDAIENRLNFIMLDSLIRQELRNSGIYTDYEFGVYSPMRNVMVIEKTGHYHKKLLEEGYAFNIFPRDLFMTPEYIMIYFPNKNLYLYTQNWELIVMSLVLIIIIAFSFIYTITTIFRQKKLSEMKNDFINNMTHEFKTPISTISLTCEVLSDKEVEKSEQSVDNYINIINEENKRLGSMAEKILQTAVIDKGQLRLHSELIDIHTIIEDVIRSIQIQVDVKNGSISKSFKARNHYINADKTHITNVIYNLFDNAIKYSPEKPVIMISTQNILKGISIVIADNGIGISKANQKKIFDKLYRVSTGNVHNVKGFGLGLHYVKTIIEAHGGRISVESELKKGTKIKIYLPFLSK